MASITLKGNPIQTSGSLPAVGSTAPDFTLVAGDLSEVSLKSYSGKKKLLSIVPSLDTGTCATSAETFNKKAAALDNTVILCISADLPFAQARFCETKGITNVIPLSSFRSTFAQDYGLKITSGPIAGLNSRSIIIIDENNKVIYTEQVPEITSEPNYDAALAVLS